MDGETRPVDYAAINALWVALAAALVAGTRGRASEDPITNKELIPLAAATFAVSKAVARERIGAWVREPFVEEEQHQRPKGGRIQRAVGELVTCTRCVGTWSALGVVGLRVLHPEAGKTVSMILATSAANDWLQAGFKLLAEQTNLVGSKLPPRD
ncbi:MAG TPA: DUF1360 domain-containing protein [Thermoleophilaceae bacterium]|jgi:hypothetical protein|nr:DUF1360 domain-containing protein [Thermoleophilaceae bacterium]